jgi:hypothetical protein
MAGKQDRIEVGDLVRKTNSTNWVWKVAEIITPAGHKPHVRLVRINYPSDERMFAIAALKDRRLFVEAGGATPARVATQPSMNWEPQAQA